jgi:hypothetical protein
MIQCELYLVKSDINKVFDYFKESARGQWGFEFQYTDVNLHLCLPLVSHSVYTKILLWVPKGHNGTVIFSNRDIYTLIYILNKTCNFDITGIMLDLDLPGKDLYLPCYYFQHWGVDNSFRIVRVMCDPRWVFYEQGESFPFEQTDKYTERIKKKRLTNDMIKDYVTAMGWNIRDEGFFDSDNEAILITIKGR